MRIMAAGTSRWNYPQALTAAKGVSAGAATPRAAAPRRCWRGCGCPAPGDPCADVLTVGTGWRTGWSPARSRQPPRCAATPRTSACYLVPYLGGVLLGELAAGHVQAMFTAIIRGDPALGQPLSAATLNRFLATLRAALNGAVRAGPGGQEPGRWPELPAAARPRAVMWTPTRIEQWQRDG